MWYRNGVKGRNVKDDDMKIFGYEIKREVIGLGRGSQERVNGTNWLLNIKRVGDEQEAMRVGVMYRCVNLISDGIAVMPLRLKFRAKAGDVFSELVDDPEGWFYMLNVKPNAWMNGFVFKKNIVTRMLLRGNAYVMALNERNRPVKLNSGSVARLVLLHSDPSFDVYSNTYGVTDTVTGISGVYGADYVLHFKNPSAGNAYVGESTLAAAKDVLSVLATGTQMQLRNFATGGRGKYVLGYEEANSGGWAGYQGEQMQGAAVDVEKQLSEHDIVTLPRLGLDLKPLSFSVDQLQFAETYKQAVEDVARFFGVPLYKITGSSSNYKTVDAAQVDFYTECLQPLCSQIEAELLSKFTTAGTWWQYKFDFDESPLFTLDMDTKARWMKAQMEVGAKTVNDLRQDMDLEPVADGDEVLMSANLKTLSMLKKEGEREAGSVPANNGGRGDAGDEKGGQ